MEQYHFSGYLNVFFCVIGCNLSEVQGIGIGMRVAGKGEYNSAHGIVVGENVTLAYKWFYLLVRSRPWIDDKATPQP